ncbi:cell growth regulator with RING finger domain protein 1-like [Erpetoichthys calabaricus]|uniref:cell growth regulator with RING finger domain protein 1-like n=1 Tax=Erpetoichthys calabaricus TaxID=27687 RepID=UPI0022349146|nr:cell growth regulator with RING finger domain protein 1-like [Erpetoichthys calabaricus]
MAEGFMIMLYEYSPELCIFIVSICFVISIAAVLSWFGFGIPGILQSFEDSESSLQIPERRMMRVKNPFALELNSTTSSYSGGVRLRHHCLENCVLTCYWGCAVHGLQKALWDHEQGVLITTPLQFEQALRGSYQHRSTLFIEKRERSEILCRLPGDSSVQDAGSLSTARYPFVALLTLEQPDKRELYEIVASVSVIHISHENFRLPSRLLYQYLLTAQGHVYDLKQLFMSANHRSRAEDSDLFCKGKEQQQEGDERATTATAASSSEEEGSVRGDRDCVVCQNAPVNQVLLPCRHTCLCDSCVERFHQCPVCRANIWESFALYQKTLHYGDRA